MQPPHDNRHGHGEHRIRRTLLAVAFAAFALYAGDYLVLRLRIMMNWNPYGTVTVQPLYAVPQKDGKMEFLTSDAQDETCVHTLFPQTGSPPCWYLNRRKEKRVNL